MRCREGCNLHSPLFCIPKSIARIQCTVLEYPRTIEQPASGALMISIHNCNFGSALTLVKRINWGADNRVVLPEHLSTMEFVERQNYKAFGNPKPSVRQGNFAQFGSRGECETFERWRASMSKGIICKAHILK